jgi:hypothetical protein
VTTFEQTSLLFSLAWHRTLLPNGTAKPWKDVQPEGPVPDWPPQDANVWRNIGCFETQESDEALQRRQFDVIALEDFRDILTKLKPVLVEISRKDGCQTDLPSLGDLEDIAVTIDHWKQHLEYGEASRNVSRYKHSSSAIVDCVRMMRFLKRRARISMRRRGKMPCHVIAETIRLGFSAS